MATGTRRMDDETRLPANGAAGERVAQTLDDRGPVRFSTDDASHTHIVAADQRIGLAGGDLPGIEPR